MLPLVEAVAVSLLLFSSVLNTHLKNVGLLVDLDAQGFKLIVRKVRCVCVVLRQRPFGTLRGRVPRHDGAGQAPPAAGFQGRRLRGVDAEPRLKDLGLIREGSVDTESNRITGPTVSTGPAFRSVYSSTPPKRRKALDRVGQNTYLTKMQARKAKHLHR